MLQLLDPSEHGMNCLEVCGGRGLANDSFQRPGLDVSVSSRAIGNTDAGGGEFHLLSSCASGRITRMLLADVCGFGPLFPAIAGRLRGLMQKNVNSVRHADFVKAMAGHLGEASQHGGYVSAQISTYFAPTRSYALCNLGHPPPLLFRARVREWSVLKPSSGPATSSTAKASPGLVDASEYQYFNTRLGSGDAIVSFSNALPECLSRDGRILGAEGVLRIAERLNPAESTQLASELISEVEGQHAGNLADVDLTVLVCRATDNRVPWKDNLLAPLRLLQTAADRTNLDAYEKRRP